MTEVAHDDEMVWRGQVLRELRLLRKTVNRHDKIIKAIPQNGTLESLKLLAKITPELQEVANHSKSIIAMADARRQDEVFWSGLKKRLNPLKPIGATIWTLILAAVSGTVYELAKFIIEQQQHG